MARGGPLEMLYAMNPMVPVFFGLAIICGIIYYYYHSRTRHSVQYQRVATNSGGHSSSGANTMSAKARALLAHLTGNGNHMWVLIPYSLLAFSVFGILLGEVSG
jgi:hypothetical protein